jgi:hypothetical protein
MNARLVALAAGVPFALGVAIGATAAPPGVAAAEQADAVAESVPGMPTDMMAGIPWGAMAEMHATDPQAMDTMHAAMADEMPPELREACDEMHAAMGQEGMSMRGGMPPGMPAGMPADHAAHHG